MKKKAVFCQRIPRTMQLDKDAIVVESLKYANSLGIRGNKLVEVETGYSFESNEIYIKFKCEEVK